ncbi:hypothetical protein F2Q68_00021084 [Brassica cretica]|uniref:Uncharacterized protein n=1 Tax=Brassica cretica TaxID=69181 RepID=A0A8S9G210_BRACR|nr:hypothetical protein F2Q68_00021084 [Brassica cretica]
MTKWKDLRPAKSTRYYRTTHPTKVLLPRSCSIDLEAKQRFTSWYNIYRSSRVKALIPRNLQKKSTGPTGSEHEALESLRFRRRIVRDYKFKHDVRRYLRVVQRRIRHHASTKGLVPPEEGMRKSWSSLDYYLVRNFSTLEFGHQELLHPSGAIDHLQQISTNTSDLHQPNLRVLPSIDMQGQDPESSWVNRPKPATSMGISISPLSISGKSTLLQVQTRPRPKKNLEKEISERRLVHVQPKGPATDKLMLMPTEASNISPSCLAPKAHRVFGKNIP